MESQVLMVLDPVQDGVRNASDADLKRCSIRYLVRHIDTDGRLNGRRLTEFHRHRRHIAQDGGIDLRLVDQAFAVQVRDALVHLRDDHAGGFHGSD